MKNFTAIALTTLAALGVTATGIGATVYANAVAPCQEANQLASNSRYDYKWSAEKVQRIGNEMMSNPFTAILKVNDLLQANREMSANKEEALKTAEKASYVCRVSTTAQSLAFTLNPSAFDSNNVSKVNEIGSEHQVWQNRQTGQLRSWLGSAVDFFTDEPTTNSAPPVRPTINTAPSVNGNPGTAPTVLFQMEEGAELTAAPNATVSSRTNVNGHKVYDIVERYGYTRSVVLWSDGSAEVFVGQKGSEKKRFVATWVERDGMAYVTIKGTFAFTL